MTTPQAIPTALHTARSPLGPVYSQARIPVVENTKASGTSFIAVAGNAGEGCVGSPGSDFRTLSIEVSNANGEIVEFSSSGVIDKSNWDNPPAAWSNTFIKLNVSALGVNVLSAEPSERYQTLSGTSMATPHVTGAVALVHSANADLIVYEIQQALNKTAWKPDDWEAPEDKKGTRTVFYFPPGADFGGNMREATSNLFEEVTLDGGESTTVTFTYQILKNREPGAYDGISADEIKSTFITIETAEDSGEANYRCPTSLHRLEPPPVRKLQSTRRLRTPGTPPVRRTSRTSSTIRMRTRPRRPSTPGENTTVEFTYTVLENESTYEHGIKSDDD